MSVMSDARAHLITLLEGTASGITRSIASGRFLHVEDDDEGAPPGMAEAPYPFEIADGGSFEPLGVPATLSGSHVYDGRRLIVRVGYEPSLYAPEALERTVTDDIATIRRCLRDPRSWDAVAIDEDGEGVTNVRVAEDRWGWVDVPTPDATQPPGRTITLEVVLELTIREDHS